jgi:hypothetical protein
VRRRHRLQLAVHQPDNCLMLKAKTHSKLTTMRSLSLLQTAPLTLHNTCYLHRAVPDVTEQEVTREEGLRVILAPTASWQQACGASCQRHALQLPPRHSRVLLMEMMAAHLA